MGHHISRVTLVVRDYDEAILSYTAALGLELVEDTAPGVGKRWVRVRPPDSAGTCLLLSKVTTPEHRSHIEDQTGGRVFLSLHTDDFEGDCTAMGSRGVHFLAEPRREAYGTVAVFEDLFGNRCYLSALNER